MYFLFLGMLTSLDDSVGSVIKALDENEMLEDSIILFISDNGAPTDDPLWGHENFGSNWPLRGVCLITCIYVLVYKYDVVIE